MNQGLPKTLSIFITLLERNKSVLSIRLLGYDADMQCRIGTIIIVIVKALINFICFKLVRYKAEYYTRLHNCESRVLAVTRMSTDLLSALQK